MEEARHADIQQKQSFLQAQVDEAKDKQAIQEKEEWPWAPTRHRMQIEQRELLQHEVLRKGYAMLDMEQLEDGSEGKGFLLLSALRSNWGEDSPIRLEQTKETITAAYACLDQKDRLALEHYLYPDGLSESWFFTMITQQQKKELLERKKTESTAS